MKPSKYNYVIRENHSSFWFNGLSLSHFSIDNTTSKTLFKYISNPDLIKENFPNFFEKLVSNGFYIKDTIDELDLIRDAHSKAVNKNEYSLIILPTLDCNFECWYCVQDHLKTKMNTETIEKVKKHIYRVANDNRFKSLNIEWFGGEPFMYFQEVIYPITSYAKKICKEKNINFITGATTNGYYLKPDIHDKIDKLQFRHFQITLDGIRDIHNSVKFSKNGDSAFDVTLSNINNLN